MWDKPQVMLWLANLLYALATVMILFGVLFVVISLPIFPLRQIKVHGDLQYVTREEIGAVVKAELKGNFFTLDLERARQGFEKMPWVRSVSVRRYWPDRLEVTLEEHRVLARWGGIGLVNTAGESFQAQVQGELPVFYGPAGSEKELTLNYLEFRRILEPMKLKPVQVVLNPRRAWQMQLDNGMTVELGRERVDERLRKFVAVYRYTVGQINRKVQTVDLRYANGFAVKLPEVRSVPAGKNVFETLKKMNGASLLLQQHRYA